MVLSSYASPPFRSQLLTRGKSRSNGVQVFVNLAEHMDVGAEIARNEKSLGKIEKEIAQLEGKLGNEKSVSKAPEAVVETERKKLADATQRRDQVVSAISELKAL